MIFYRVSLRFIFALYIRALYLPWGVGFRLRESFAKMSFQEINRVVPRLNRSELAVPASQTKFFEKAARSDADIIFLDLEDSVAPDEKPQARKNAIDAINDIDWGRKTLSLRINGLDTEYCYQDLVTVLENAGDRLDLIMLPKIGTGADIYAMDLLVTQIERAKKRKKPVGFEILIESALGMKNIFEIAGASKRNESLHFGPGDFAASIHARSTSIGDLNPDYAVLNRAEAIDDNPPNLIQGDMWHSVLFQILLAARSHGLRPIDGAFGDFSDSHGFAIAAKRAAAIGFEGKWAIHPSQISPANEIMSPTEPEIAQARKILKAMEDAERAGQGAVSLDGKLIDYASMRQAEMLIAKIAQINAKS